MFKLLFLSQKTRQEKGSTVLVFLQKRLKSRYLFGPYS